MTRETGKTAEKNLRYSGGSDQRYKDSNLEMTESESVALPFGDSAKFHAKVIIAYL